MRVCILIEDGYSNFNADYYLQNYSLTSVVMEPPVKKTLHSISKASEFDVYLNLCEGYSGWYYSGIEVVRALEELNLPFTGADSRFYIPTREEMQSAGDAVRVGFIQGGNVSNVGEVDSVIEGLRFPLMVKHPNSYGSTGMTRKSRVKNMQELKQQVRRICKRFGSARVEEFIDGREFTTLIVDNPDDLSHPFVYPPAEVIFPPGETFLYAHVKWKKYVYLKRVDDDALESRLKMMTAKLYKALHGVGYARCDFRMNKDGELFMLEINPNCGILYEPKDIGHADIMMEYDKDGHDGFIDRMFRSARVRHQARLPVEK
jgi:D-alanine-D-alanine ligase